MTGPLNIAQFRRMNLQAPLTVNTVQLIELTIIIIELTIIIIIYMYLLSIQETVQLIKFYSMSSNNSEDINCQILVISTFFKMPSEAGSQYLR